MHSEFRRQARLYFQCSHCRYQCSLVSGTIFEASKHDYDLDNPTIALSLHDSMVQGFNEDKAIIEGQQEVLDADPNFKMNAIVADAPLAHFRRVLQRAIEDERAVGVMA